MAINKLTAGPKGSPSNSKGADVAAAVNALIDEFDQVLAHPEGTLADALANGTADIGGQTAQSVADLRGDLQQEAGADEIGFEGSTVYGALDLQIRRPRKTIAKLFASASAVAHVKLCVLGDSLSGAKPIQFIAALDRKIGGENRAGVNTSGSASGAGTASGGNDLTFDSTVSMTTESNFDYWPTGSVRRFDDGGSALLRFGGSNPYFTDITVYFVKEPSAGTISLTVDGSVVDTESAAAASVSVGVLQFTQAIAQKSASLSITGGSVRVLFAHITNTTIRGVDWYNSMNIGGLLLAAAVASAQCRAIWQSCINLIQPDLITFEMDDNFGDGGENAAAWLTLAGILDSAAPNADKLVTASTPRSTGDDGKIASSRWLRGQVAARGNDYLFFDSYNIFGSYAQMVAIFGPDDGTHPNVAAQAYAAEALWQQLGLSANILGYAQQAVNNVGTPSAFARGSQFRGPSNNQLARVALETDSSNGYDWVFKYPRTLTFGTDGSFNTSAANIWQFSGNTAVNPNVMPIAIDFNSAGNVRKMDTSTLSGFEFTRFRKTDNPGGGLMHLQVGLVRNSFTRAELLAIPANQVVGAYAFCSDCTGGPQLVYAAGGGAADWRTVDGKSSI